MSLSSAVIDRAGDGLDAISKAIIEQLQTDGRRSYAKSRRRSDCPRPRSGCGWPGWSRLGVMQIVAVTNPLQLGFTRQAMIGIKAEGISTIVDAFGDGGDGLRRDHRRIVRHSGRSGLRGR